MSTINTLTIKGIRSFGIDREDEQKIEFQSPLTLIVGQNGCGKTTVIECLKYALTGDKPPGTDGGRTFVHDPKVSKSKTSLAQVKLTVTNSDLIEKTVVRSMRSEVQKGGKLKFETLDSTIITLNPNGKREDIAGRVEDINNNMCQFMGVSKAIINNVIFCHQEDSNWPLDEGKKLKEKFDAIFGTTQYNKAIDKLIKIRKNFQIKLAEEVGIMNLNLEVKQQADKMAMDLERALEACAEIEQERDEASAKILVVEKKKEELQKLEKTLVEYIDKQRTYKMSIDNKKKAFESLKEKLKRPLQGTIEDLQEQLRNFKQEQDKKEDQRRKLERECAEIAAEERKCQEAMNQCTVKMQRYQEQMSEEQQLEHDKFVKTKELCEILDIPFDDYSQSVDTDQMNTTSVDIDQKILEEDENLNEMKNEAMENGKLLQEKIDNLRDKRVKLETEISTLEKLIQSSAQNRVKISKEIAAAEQSIPALNQLAPMIEKAEKNLETIKADSDRINELKDELQLLETEKTGLDDKVRSIQTEIEVLHELEPKQKDLDTQKKDLERIKNKIMPTMKDLFGREIPESNFRMNVSKKKENLEKEVKTFKEKLQNLQRESDKLEERRSNIRKEIERKSDELKKIKSNIDDLCKGQDYKNYLASQKEKAAKLSMELAVLRSSENTNKDFIQKIDEHPNCPLCHKTFEDDEGENLKVELQEKIQELPDKIDSIEKKLKKEQKLYDTLNSYKSSYDSIERLEKEKTNLEDELTKIDASLQKNEQERETSEFNLVEPEELFKAMTASFMTDAFKIDELQRNIASKSKEVEAAMKKLPKNFSNRTLKEAQEERKNLSASLDKKILKIRENTSEITKHNDKLNEAHKEVNNLNAKKNQFQEKVQGIDRLKEQYETLKKEVTENERKRDESKTKLGPINESLKKANDDKEKAYVEDAKKIKEAQDKLNKITIQKAELERIKNELEALQKLNLSTLYAEQKEVMKGKKEKSRELSAKAQKKMDEIDLIKADINNEESTHRNIRDNIELREIEKDKQEAYEKLQELEKIHKNVDINKFKQEKQQVSAELDNLVVEKARLNGVLGTRRGNCTEMQKDLEKEKYKNAEENYMNSIYSHNALQAAIDDLAKYRTALEKSLLKFHQDKMDQINQLLREYWNAIYSGNDIDYIMIKTDEEETGKTAASDKKRSYNYRVIQSKNGSEVDMRGRCSAGQKVLASLIIRMALADTFSLNCGILALDEPTTNLDSANIRSLCNALARIVRERDDGTGKFMLLVITHDEEFANNLERADFYWKLSRDNRGCSRIEKKRND